MIYKITKICSIISYFTQGQNGAAISEGEERKEAHQPL